MGKICKVFYRKIGKIFHQKLIQTVFTTVEKEEEGQEKEKENGETEKEEEKENGEKE